MNALSRFPLVSNGNVTGIFERLVAAIFAAFRSSWEDEQ